MKLCFNAITKGRYFKAGEEIPDDLLSDGLRKYAMTDAEIIQQQRREADDIESKPAPSRPKRGNSFVKRGDRFVLASKVEVIAGEMLYWDRKKSFGVDERFIAYAKAGSE